MKSLFSLICLMVGLIVGTAAGHYHGVAVTLEKQVELARSNGAAQLTGYIDMINQLDGGNTNGSRNR